MGRKKGPVGPVWISGMVALVALVSIIGVVATRGAATGPLLTTRTVGVDPDSVVVDERAGHVFVANQGDETVSMLDARDGRVVGAIALAGKPAALALDGRRGHLLVSVGAFRPGANGTVATLDTRSGAMLYTSQVGTLPTALAIDRRVDRAYVINSQDDTLSTLDLASGRVVRTAPVGFDPTMGYAPNAIAIDEWAGRVFTANSSDDSVSMFDASNGRLLRVVPLGRPASDANWVAGMAVAGDGGHLFVANATGPGGGVRICRPAPCPGSQPLASATQPGGQIRMLDARTGAVVRTIRLGWSPDAIALDPLSGRVLARSFSGPGLLLDARTGAVVRALTSSGNTWDPIDKVAVDARTGRIYVLRGAPADRSHAILGTGSVLVLDGRTKVALRVIPVGLLPRDLAVDSRTGRLFVSNLSDSEGQRYGYRPSTAGAVGGSDPWGWVPQPVRGWLPMPTRPQPPSDTFRNGTVSVIDTTHP